MVARGAMRDLGKIANIVRMARHAVDMGELESDGPPGAPQARTIATATDWDIAEYTCHCGPADRAFEEQHGHYTIAAVLQGHFTYRTDNGRGLMQPGPCCWATRVNALNAATSTVSATAASLSISRRNCSMKSRPVSLAC